MARGKSRGGRGGGGGRGGKRDTRTGPWSEERRENSTFEDYYRRGGFLEKDEFEKMWKALQTNLPSSFRFTGTKSDALAVREVFKTRYIPAIAAIDFEGRPVEPPKVVNAFPDELVWDIKTDKKVIRRHPPFKAFHEFLVSETQSGNISRQEVASMIPPHFLDVKPGMVVLDMCAAPGSKSAQLAEMIHGDEEDRVREARKVRSPTSRTEVEHNDDGTKSEHNDDGRSTGLLIANDSDLQRAGMLVHQVKRLNFSNLIVTQHDASIFPSIELPSTAKGAKQYLKFDRILADVPCSGDGTARKNPNIWQKWNPRDALGLHNLQLRILLRGLQLLKKGGRLAYSTCSMNPVENEAVIAAAVAACGGVSKIQLIDCAGLMPNLKRKPGLRTWKVLDASSLPSGDKKVHMFSTWEIFSVVKDKYAVEDPDRQFSDKMSRSCFPPSAVSDQESIPLERCMRIYPHLQDTGGFFIAVLEKLDDIKVNNQTMKAPIEAESRELQTRTNGSSVQIKSTPPGDQEPESSEQMRGKQTPERNPLKRKLVAGEGTAAPKKPRADDIPAEANPSETDQQNIVSKVNGADPGHVGCALPSAPSQEKTKPRPDNQSLNKEYFMYLSTNHPTILSIFNFYGISDRFPRHRFMVRNEQGLPLRKIYFTSALAKDIILQNRDRGVRFIHCGVVMFTFHGMKGSEHLGASFRLQLEGIRILEPWVCQRIVNLDRKETFRKLLIDTAPKLPKEGPQDLDAVGFQMRQESIGCCLLIFQPTKDETGLPLRMVFPIWRHPASANLMISNDDRKAMLLRWYNERDPVIIKHVQLGQEETPPKEAKAKEEAAAKTRKEQAKNGDRVSDGVDVCEVVESENDQGGIALTMNGDAHAELTQMENKN